MNTSGLKKFAQGARKKLIDQVGAKLAFVLSTDSAELREKSAQIKTLREELNKVGKEQLIEKVAYTWFNRLVALRYMDVNDYQPTGIRIISPKDDFTTPEILDEVKQGHIPEEIKIDRKRIFEILDGKIPSSNPQNEAYRLLLIAACNHLSSLFPFLYERINDYTELLLPDDLTSEFSIVHDIVQGMSSEDCIQVEIIGWLYQFYISEKKDEVFASKSKVKKEDIPAATQLFTPRWIVEYMLQNTLGKLWLQNKPDSKLREHMPYFIESESLKADDYLKVGSVEEIKFLDQALGSGHILVYAFELFYKIYEEEGYAAAEIPSLIIEKNLYGFEIDERAAQLAGFAILMKAREHQKRLFKKDIPVPNILLYKDVSLDEESIATTLEEIGLPVIEPSALYAEFKLGSELFNEVLNKAGIEINKASWNKIPAKKRKEVDEKGEIPALTVEDLFSVSISKLNGISEQLKNLGIELTSKKHKEFKLTAVEIIQLFKKHRYLNISSRLLTDLVTLQQSTNFGSLIIPKSTTSEINGFFSILRKKGNISDAFLQINRDEIETGLAQLKLLAEKYHCIVDNPPYMGGGNVNKELSDFLGSQYPDSKSDLMACFMESGLAMLKPKGFLGMINQHSWMFLSSYEDLRKKFIENFFIDTLIHLGSRTFPEIGGEVVQNASFTFWNVKPNIQGTYVRLVDFDRSESKRIKTLEVIQDPNSSEFHYKISQTDFKQIPGYAIGYWLSDKAKEAFTEFSPLSQIAKLKQGMATTNNDLFMRRWFECAQNKTAFSLSDANATLDEIKWVPYSKGGGFRKWYGNQDYIVNFQNNGQVICDYIDNTPGVKVKSNGRVINRESYFKEALTWSLTSSNGFGVRYRPNGSVFDVNGMSLFLNDSNDLKKLSLMLNSKVSFELLKTINPTLAFQKGDIEKLPAIIDFELTINPEDIINISKEEWDSRENSWNFKRNELIRVNGSDIVEAFNYYQEYWKNKFYCLHKYEETLNQQFIEIYGLQNELTPNVQLDEITILKEEASIQNGELTFHGDEIFAQFLSYAVGCMFGRYSLDKAGLILANQGETFEDYLKVVSRKKCDVAFLPDEDNIIPVLDDEWFEGDMVTRFYEFLKASFGEENFRKNLTFIEEQLGKDIRKHFVKDFYNDHIKRYKKRPIYWMFSSPKGHFNVLIYLHRYTPDTLNKILNKYLREFIEKLKTRKDHFKQIQISGSAAEQNSAIKEIDKLDKMILDCQEYEREILYPLATERIAIDLDDGVLVNYNKFGKAVKEVAGLNDAKTKKSVREFDWIDTTQIR